MKHTPGPWPDLLDAIVRLFPDDDWSRYEGVPLTERLVVELTCTKSELVGLRQAIAKAKGEVK